MGSLPVCGTSGIAFAERVLTAGEIEGKDVLEVGSLDFNGSIRPHVESLKPARYVGVDMMPGQRVDIVMDAAALVERFGPASFDVVLTTEMMEHVRDWPTVISNLKRVLRPGGLLLVTTRSIGFQYHGYPYDFWRYEPEDMRVIFTDLDIEVLERDPDSPGVFLLARQREHLAEVTPVVALYSIILGRRVAEVSDFQIRNFRVRHWLAPRMKTTRRMATKARKRLRSDVVVPLWAALPTGARVGIKRVLRRS
ncbi:MAG TPA: class I SAM-dependent methyltransferase [Candidatus Limnocylindrales bacterium]|jgi:SAM-dependent methyltransferase